MSIDFYAATALDGPEHAGSGLVPVMDVQSVNFHGAGAANVLAAMKLPVEPFGDVGIEVFAEALQAAVEACGGDPESSHARRLMQLKRLVDEGRFSHATHIAWS